MPREQTPKSGLSSLLVLAVTVAQVVVAVLAIALVGEVVFRVVPAR